MRRLFLIVAALLLLAPTDAIAAEPAPGQMQLETDSGLTMKHQRYVMRHQRVDVVGTTRPYAPGQDVMVEIRRNGKVEERIERPIRESSGGKRALRGELHAAAHRPLRRRGEPRGH